MVLSARVRRGYSMGSVATGTFGTVPGLLLLPYLTDELGVAAALAGLIAFLPKGWDVILNPIAGRISDRSRSPRGRRRPYLLWAGVPLAVTFTLIFTGPQSPPPLAATWVFIAFLLCATAYAFFQVPYNAIPAEVTSDAAERTRMMTWRVAVIAVAIMLSGGTAPLVVESSGYATMGFYVGVLLLIGTVGSYYAMAGAPENPTEAPSGRLREQVRVALAEPDFRRLLFTYVIQALAIGMLLAGVAYVARYLLGDPATATLIFFTVVGPALIITPLWGRLATRRGKKYAFVAASLVLIAGVLVMWSVRDAASSGLLWVVLIGTSLTGIGYAGTQMCPLAMLPDVAAASMRATGENRTGLFTGLYTAGETLGFALGPGVFGLVLAFGGYVESTGEQVAQPESALDAIAVGYTIVPAVIVALSLFPLLRYSLDERTARV